MKVFKQTEDYTVPYSGYVWPKGRLFIKYEGEAIALATPTLATNFCGNYFLEKLQEVGILKEVELADEKWAHPHLLKKVREKFVSE